MARQPQQQPSQAPFILLGGLVLAGAGFYTGWPGMAALWLAMLVAGWAEPPVVLTGPKDSTGYPTAANQSEERNLATYAMWREAKWRLLVPNTDWLPGWPILGSFIGATVAGAAAFCIPVIHADLRWANAAATFVTVATMTGARRRTLAEDICPGARINTLPELVRTKFYVPLVAVIGAVATGYLASTFIPEWRPSSAGPAGPITTARVDPENAISQLVDYGSRTPSLAVASLSVLAFLSILAVPWTSLALEHWRLVVAARAEWKPRWQALKFDPAPFLIDRQTVGEATVDTFMAPASQGAMAFWPLKPKVQPTVGAGSKVIILDTPDEGPEGPVPGTRHPLRFEVAVWPMNGWPSFTDPDLDMEVAALAARCAMIDAVDAVGFSRPVLLGIEPLHGEGAEAGAWETKWSWPDGPGLTVVRESQVGNVSGSFGCEALVDHRGDSVFVGALTIEPPSVWVDEGPGLPWAEFFERMDREDVWNGRWAQVLKQGVNPPTPEQSTTTVEQLPDGTEIHRQAFMTRVGIDPRDFYNAAMEKKVATALSAASFVSITGWSRRGDRPGERHPQAFGVYWSSTAVPGSPTTLIPAGRGSGGSAEAVQWVLTSIINRAFDGARLPRPEIASAQALTRPDSRRNHMWEVVLRLHDGVTLSDVRGAASRLRTGMGVPWLRVTPHRAGCVLFVGGTPQEVELANPRRDLKRVMALDWEQAWLDAGVSGVGGLLPELVDTGNLPSNEQVEVLDFKLPAGVDIATVKNGLSKLMASTNNAFIEVRPGPDASTTRLLVCEVNPIPERVGFDFEAIDDSSHILFATGVEGEPLGWDPTESPHALIAGTTGSGKAEPLTNRIPVPVSERFPAGWATIGEIAVGDQVFAADGSVTNVVGLSDIVERPSHSVHLSDGQVIECGPEHLWKVSSANSRATWRPRRASRRQRRFDAEMGRASGLRSLASGVPAGTVATGADIAAMAGVSDSVFYAAVPLELAVQVEMPTKKKASRFCGSEIADYMRGVAARRGALRICGLRFTADEIDGLGLDGRWLTVREVADIALGGGATRQQRDRFKGLILGQAAATRIEATGTAVRSAYPIDESLVLIAERIEAFAGTTSSGVAAEPLERIVSTADMAETLRRTSLNDRVNWAVRVTSPIDPSDADLALSPYVLGVWLGDGTSRSAEIQGVGGSSTDDNGVTDFDHVVSQISSEGFSTHVKPSDSQMIVVEGLRPLLRSAGLLQNKHIPAAYLRASAAQRLALLQGLMDTDGTVDRSGACELSFCDERLASDALELIRSLGINCAMTTGPATLTEVDPDRPGHKRRRVTGTRWRLNFTTTTPVFRLPRKAARIPESVRGTQDWLYVTDITVGESVPMRCISVDHPEHMYLTAGFVPTHNSVLAQAFIYGTVVAGYDVYVIDPVKAGADFVFAKDRCRAFAATPFEAAGVMKAVYAEVVVRKNLNAEHGVGSIDELPEDIRPPHVFVFIDEFTSLMGRSPVPKTDDPSMQDEIEAIEAENHARTEIGVFAGKLAREARSAGVHLGLGTQKLTAKMLDSIPGATDLKPLPLDVRLPVPASDRFPDGWALNSELDLGDLLYGVDGSAVPILGFSEVVIPKTYRLVFDDGQSIEAGAQHWWTVASMLENKPDVSLRAASTEVLTTEQIAARMDEQWAVPLSGPIQSTNGDGLAAAGTDDRIYLFEVGRRHALGLERMSKSWLRAGVEERERVFAGMADAWGSSQDQSLRFTVTSRTDAAISVELARSLGHLVRSTGTAPGSLVVVEASGMAWNRIVSVVETDPVPMRCIGVDHPDHLFLVEGFISTHNTNLARSLLGKASFGDRASALRAPDDAPRIDGEVPKGRGLWEPLSSTAVVIQTWFEGQSRLRAELESRVPSLPDSERLDLSGFEPELDVIEGPSSRPTQERQFIDVGELDLTLDDLTIDLDLDELDAFQDDETETDDDLDPGDPDLDDPDLEDPDLDAALDGWDGPDEEASLASVVFFDMASVGPALADDEMADAVADLDAQIVGVVDDEVDPLDGSVGIVGRRPNPEYGWWKLDAVLGWLDAHPEVEQVVWVDSGLADSDAELMLDLVGVKHMLVDASGFATEDLHRIGEWLFDSSEPPVDLPAPDLPVGPPAVELPPEASSANRNGQASDSQSVMDELDLLEELSEEELDEWVPQPRAERAAPDTEPDDDDGDDPFAGPAWTPPQPVEDDLFG